MNHRFLRLALAVAALAATALPAESQLVASARSSSENRLRLLPTPGRNLPTPVQQEVPLLEDFWNAGLATYSPHFALVGESGGSRILVVDLSTSTTVDLVTVPGYGGDGTIVVSPDRGWALVASGSTTTPTTLHVIQAPFGASSQVGTVQLPGSLGGWQSHGIVFDRNGRAFAYHSIGISVLDPPYQTIAFTIPVSDNGSPGGGGIAIAPDDQTLLVTKLRTAFTYVGIFHAPFSAASIQETVQIPNSRRLDAIAVAPDNSFALVTSYTDPQLFVIAAPFDASSAVEQIPMPVELDATGPGFEHVSFHPGGKLVVLSGGSVPPPNDPYVFVEAPFTAAEATVHLVWPAGNFDRGSNAAIFLPAPLFADGFESGDTGSWSQAIP